MSAVNEQSLFDMEPDPGQALVGDAIVVNVDQALVMTGCDNIADPSVIVPWSKTDVIGKFNLDTGTLNAAAVMVRSPRLEGRLVSIVASGEGHDLEIMPLDATTPETVFLPDVNAITLGVEHGISIELLQELLTECNKTLNVSASLLANPDYPEAGQVTVKPEKVTGVVQSVGAPYLIEIADDQESSVRLHLLETMDVIAHGEDGDQTIAVTDVMVGDRVTAFGLFYCPNGEVVDFLASTIVVQPDDESVFQLPETIPENDEVVMLPEGTYNQGLTVNGNNFSLTGDFVSGCSNPGWTEISGDVVINGNKARFENIKFSGNVTENGNNAQFINCCFEPARASNVKRP